MRFERPGPSPLQVTLDQSHLSRNLVNYENGMGAILPGRILLREWMRRRFREAGSLRFMDGGCGNGLAVNHFSWHMPGYLRLNCGDENEIAGRLEGIGLDTHLPADLPQQFADRPNAPMRFLEGSVETMEGVDSGSIDIGIGYAVLRYVPDKLAAIRSGWRVLKENGVFIWLIYKPAFIEPGWDQLGCDPTQHSYVPHRPNHWLDSSESSWLITQRRGDTNGIPAWEFSRAEQPVGKIKPGEEFRKFDRVSYYTKDKHSPL